jgi:hypothetical protein
MTTPDERRRHLIWGEGELAELSQDAALKADWRREAAELLAAYPALERLQDGDEADLALLQTEFVDVLSASKWFFYRVMGDPSCPPERRYSLRVVLRHFG